MSKGTAAVAILVAAVALLYVLRDVSWPCGVTIHRRGHGMFVKDGNSTRYGPISGSRNTYGAIVVSTRMRTGNDRDQPLIIETTNFRGNGDLKFQYAGDITKVYLWSGNAVVYEGPPLNAYHAPSQEIGMYFEWNGPEATVEIMDTCSLSSYWYGPS